MTNINLLPWREKRRRKAQKNYQLILFFTAIFGFLISYLMSQYFAVKISHQSKRNDFIEVEIRNLDEKIIEIKELHKTREQLIERMKLIQNLQGNRPIIVRIFDEMVTAVPNDLFLTKMELQGNKMSLEGSSKSNDHVATFMRNLDVSEWFSHPQLIHINQGSDGLSNFEILLQQIEPIFDRRQVYGDSGDLDEISD